MFIDDQYIGNGSEPNYFGAWSFHQDVYSLTMYFPICIMHTGYPICVWDNIMSYVYMGVLSCMSMWLLLLDLAIYFHVVTLV